jgi:thiol-disulfide isomerase/thioredoxin
MMQLKLRRIVWWSCFAATVSLPAEIKIGDSAAQVLQEKGRPGSKLVAGTVQILHYPDQTIKLQDGLVVAVQAATPSPAAVNVAAAPSATAINKKPVPQAGTDAPLTWHTDYAAALAQAKTDNRHVFLFFTGSDWCSWCKRLNQEILTTPEFARYAQEKLILVEIDFPRTLPQAAALKVQNAKLAKRYHIEGYPTAVILDSTGKKIDTLGYQEGGPAPFVARLSKL